MSHPDTAELLDHLEGKAPALSDHLASCASCGDALSDLRAALDVDARAFPPASELETERALGKVLGQAHARRRNRWIATFGFTAAAAAFLAFALPTSSVLSAPAGPVGGGEGTAAVVKPALDVPAPDVRPNVNGLDPRVRELVSGLGSNVAVVVSPNPTK